ncbi:MAG TPA: glycosyltransferase family 4 protein [Bacteroidales bacterium]|nr:glycosyltransferase family 4 protein [Bacteroidales bacterium]
MKILMVLESIFTGDTRVENEALSLISDGHDVSIICYSETKRTYTETHRNISLFRIGISPFIKKSSIGALRFPIYFKFWTKEIKRILSLYDFHAIHIHDLPLIKIGYDIANEYNLKLVLDLHENFPALLNISEHTKTFLGRLLCSIPQWEEYEIEYVNKVDNIIVVIEEARERLISLGADTNKIKVVSNYLKTETFKKVKKKPFNNDRITFIYLGGVTYHRGLQFVIEATKKLKNYSDRFNILIIGDGRFVPTLKIMVRKYELHNVEFTGWLAESDSFEKLGEGDIAIIPHIKSAHTDNTIPHKLFFYMYYGFPVISSDCMPIKRIIEESNAGLTFPSGNSEMLASLMEKFILSPQLINDYSSSTHAVEKKYNWEIESVKLKGIYKDLNQT